MRLLEAYKYVFALGIEGHPCMYIVFENIVRCIYIVSMIRKLVEPPETIRQRRKEYNARNYKLRKEEMERIHERIIMLNIIPREADLKLDTSEY